MNQKTIVTLAIVAAVGVGGYFVWQHYKSKQATSAPTGTGNVTPSPNPTTDPLAQQIQAGTNALNTVADALGF